ncbi:hypothetical protein [Sphingomonas sp. KR3-1]|uniref:hypothetical protein n=1 Tax=Sphingomonas sp. KR3-1 TaxID=3156611 RepID=UPI0032B5E09F
MTEQGFFRFFAIAWAVIAGAKLAGSLLSGTLLGARGGRSARAIEPGKFWINWSLLAITFVISVWCAIFLG